MDLTIWLIYYWTIDVCIRLFDLVVSNVECVVLCIIVWIVVHIIECTRLFDYLTIRLFDYSTFGQFDYSTILLLLSASDYSTWWWARTGGLYARPTRCHLRPPAAHAASMPPLFEMIISIISISIIINASLVCNDRSSASLASASASASSSMPPLFEMIISISSISRATILPYACEEFSLLEFSDYSKPNVLSKVSFLIFQFLFQMKK